MLNQNCHIEHLPSKDIQELWNQHQRFDLTIAVDLFEHLEKNNGMQVLARLRDVLCPQYCVCLPLAKQANPKHWHLTDLFSFALSKVDDYSDGNIDYGLFKYNIDDYKKTPDWLNANNWANPAMWGKYWW